MTTSDVLDKAADMIDDLGWWNGDDANGSSGVCAGLAISTVSRLFGVDRTAAEGAFVSHLGLPVELWGDNWMYCSAIYDWNDTQTNGATVVAALRDAARVNTDQRELALV